MRLSRAALVGVLVLVLAPVAVLIVLAWPRAEDVQLRSAYAQVEASRVPVKTLGWIAPRAARAELGSDGYTLQVSDPDLGEVVISGCRQCPDQSGAGDVRWTESDVTYAVRTTA